MQKIGKAFDKKTIFIPFLMAGHPSVEMTIQAIHALSEAGSKIIELGVPFSDPIADGSTNQRAAEVALKNQVTVATVLDIVKQVRKQDIHTPIILFTYLNPILAMGIADFAQKAKAVGVNGVLFVDLPPEEGEDIYPILVAADLDIVLLVSPTTDPSRYQRYQKLNPGFIYYISRCGVTGAQADVMVGLEKEVKNLRQHFPHHQKIVVGFGISRVEQVKQVAKFADGVVMGSYLVEVLESQGVQALGELAAEMVKGCNIPPE